MSDKFSLDFNPAAEGGHPHDLLARLYREIGISAVAAALEAAQSPDYAAEPPVVLDDHRAHVPAMLRDDIAA